ncbi:MAG: lipid kinase [Wenzhouxiangella sp.]|nr:lipid kinase [Wenzhouxiangella sp.]
MSIASLLLSNPGSRSGDTRLDEVADRLERLGKLIRIQPETPEELPEAIREHGKQVDQVVLGGGDGSVNLALDALIEVNRPLGLLPLGTANDLARSLSIPEDINAAMDIITRGHLRRIDVARANDVSFVNAIGMGLGPRMTREMDGDIKQRFGVLAYLIGVFRALRGQRCFAAEVSDQRRRRVGRFLQITVANGIHYGGGMTVSEDAKLDDGMLDVLLVERQSRLSLLLNALRFRTGQTRGADNVIHWRCRELQVETRPALEITANGEFLSRTPVSCSVCPGALGVFAPE